jgi:hypothetical protein
MYKIGNFSFCILDMDAERGARVSTDDVRFPAKTFVEEAKAEIEDSTKWTPVEERQQFMTAYYEGGLTIVAERPHTALSITATGENYIYNSCKKHMIGCVSLAVFSKNSKHYHKLWEVKHFKIGDSPIFLNKHEMLAKLRPILGHDVNAEEGFLTVNNIKFVVWHITSSKGEFFIPWHSGAILNKEEGYTFTACPFKEMPQLYNYLKFKEVEAGVYGIKLC